MAEKRTIIVPTYNEENRLRSTLESLIRWLAEKGWEYEIILADDGSTDRTPEIIRGFQQKNPRIRLVMNPHRIGRGATLQRVIPLASGSTILYVDADLATSLEGLDSLIQAIRNGCAVATGSRYHLKSRAKREIIRYLLSKGYNGMLRFFFSSLVSDHQCGFKAFQKNKVLPLLPYLRAPHWFWDTEILIKAQKKGLRVEEIPVEWEEKEGSKLNMVKDILEMAWGMLVLGLDIYVRKFY